MKEKDRKTRRKKRKTGRNEDRKMKKNIYIKGKSGMP